MLPQENPYHSLYSALRRLNPEISEVELQKVKNLFKPREIPQGRMFVGAGEKPTQLAFTISGLFRYYYVDFNGVEVTKHFCLEHDFVASYSALLLQEESELYIEALEDSKLLVCNYQEWQRLLENNLCWQIIARRVIEGVFILMEKRERSLLLEDAQTRYVRFLHQNPRLKDRVRQYHIASYLGISPVTLSRIHTRGSFKTPF